MRFYAIVPALPKNIFSFEISDDLTSTDLAVWTALCFSAAWTGGGIGGSKIADCKDDFMTGYAVVDYKTIMATAYIRHKHTLYNSLKKLEKRGLIERKYHGPLVKSEYILHIKKQNF